MSDNHPPTKKASPSGSGLAVAGSFWVWGALLFWAPEYLQVGATWRAILTVLGALSLAISFGGAGTELAKTLKTEAFSYWGIGLLFGLPAVLLHVAVIHNRILPSWSLIARIAVLLLAAFSGPFLLYGIPHLFDQKAANATDSGTTVSSLKVKKNGAERMKFVFALIVGILNLITAILKLIARSP